MHKNLLKVILPAVLILVAAVGALQWIKTQIAEPHSGPVLKVGDIAPDFELIPLKGPGQTVTQVMDAAHAKLIVVNFWATWCTACLVEMPSLQKLWKSRQSKGVAMAAVSVDEGAETLLPPFIEKMKLELPVFIDKDQTLGGIFDVQGIPFTVILDHNRKVLYTETGERDWNSTEVHEQLDLWLQD